MAARLLRVMGFVAMGALVQLACTQGREPARTAAPALESEPSPAALQERATQVALGAYHTCALLASGQVACWGDNSLGQLGNGTDQPSPKPMLVHGLNDAVEIDAGYSTTCARRRNGRVACWGGNAHGQADPRPDPALSSSVAPAGAADSSGEPPSHAPQNVRRIPTELSDPPAVSALALGAAHSCALDAASRAVCWGDASHGQLGAAPADAFQRAIISGPPPLVQIDAAGQYSCARSTAGEVWCWGENTHQQLGSATTGPEPRPVPGVSGAVDLRLTADRACARLADGQWQCWGDSGACADTESRQPPARALELDGSIALARASGGCFWCLLAHDHTLRCGPSPAAKDGLTLRGVAAIATGNDHACALLLDGTVQCWGSNVRGELGRTTPQTRDDTPAPVSWQAQHGSQH